MTDKLMPDKQPEFFTPNAPVKYAMAGGRGVMIGCGIICHRRNCRAMLGLWLE